MSILSKTLKKVGKSGITRGLGKAIDFGSDFLPPGFRDVGNLGGKLMQGQNLKKAALGTAGDYVGGRLAKGLGSKLSGIGKNAAIAGGASALANDPKFNPDNLSKLIKNADGSYADGGHGFDWGGAFKAGAGALTGAASNPGIKDKLLGGVTGLMGGGHGMPGLGDLAKYALPALGAYQASKAAGKADEYRKKGLAGVEAEYAAAKPLRDMGLAGMTDPRMADVSSLFNQQRPQYRRIG